LGVFVYKRDKLNPYLSEFGFNDDKIKENNNNHHV